MIWILFLALNVIFFMAPYQRGLFFDADFYVIEGFILLLFLGWLAGSYFIKTIRVPNFYFTVFLIPLLYVLLFAVAETPKGNFDNLLRWLVYASFFVMLVWLRNNKWVDQSIPFLFQMSGIVLVLFSLSGAWGWVEYRDLLMGDRLAGPYQYANSFAAVIGTYWLFSLVQLTNSRNTLFSQILYSLPLVAYGVSFFHAYSRGAVLAFAVVWFLGLLLLKFKNQILYVLVTSISVGFSLLVFGIFIKQEQAGVSLPGLWPVLIGTVVVCGICVILSWDRMQSWFSKWTERPIFSKYGRFSMAIVILVIGALLLLDISNQGWVYRTLPGSLQQRIGDINLETTSAVGRTGMFEDALEISKHSPLFGFGGEGWRIVYHLYQTKPYYSNEVHNGYLEILLNTGWIGLLLFVSVIFYLLLEMLRSMRMQEKETSRVRIAASITALFMLFLHAFVDFDFSYGSVWLIIFWLIAMNVPYDRATFNLNVSIFKTNKTFPLALNIIVRSVLTMIVLAGMIFAFRFHSAESQIAKANGISINDGIQFLEQSFSLNPYHVDVGVSLANAYLQYYIVSKDENVKTKLLDTLEKIERLEQHNARILYVIGQIHSRLGDWEKTIEYFERAVKMEKYNVNYYEGMINYTYALSQFFQSQGMEFEAREMVESSIRYYEQYLDWFHVFKNQLIPDSRPMDMSYKSLLAVARAYQFTGDHENALKALIPANPRMEPGIYDFEHERLLTESIRILSLPELIQQYSNQMILMTVVDEASAGLSDEVKTMLSQMGSQIDSLGYRGSYVGIIYQGNMIFERINNEGDISVNQENTPELKDLFHQKPFHLYSAGLPYGNHSSIQIDGVEYSKNLRGINIAIFDQHMNLLGKYNFDTFLSEITVVADNS